MNGSYIREAVEEIVQYLNNRYQINVSTENFIRNTMEKAIMRNPTKERLEAKLKLWETPGFSQFLKDLEDFIDVTSVVSGAEAVKRLHQEELRLLVEKEAKLEQGKLNL